MTIYIVALIAVLLFMLYDYLHDKADWSLKTYGLKYVICLAAAWFYATLQKITFFQYLQVAGVIVLAGMFGAVIMKWLSQVWTWIKTLTTKKS